MTYQEIITKKGMNLTKLLINIHRLLIFSSLEIYIGEKACIGTTAVRAYNCDLNHKSSEPWCALGAKRTQPTKINCYPGPFAVSTGHLFTGEIQCKVP